MILPIHPGVKPGSTALDTWLAASFKISEDNLAEFGDLLARCGVSDPEMLDLFTALGTGLTDQQLSNDPGGDRWIRLIDDAAEMFYEHVTKKAGQPARGRRTG